MSDNWGCQKKKAGNTNNTMWKAKRSMAEVRVQNQGRVPLTGTGCCLWRNLNARAMDQSQRLAPLTPHTDLSAGTSRSVSEVRNSTKPSKIRTDL